MLLLPRMTQKTMLLPGITQTPGTVVPDSGLKALIAATADIWVDINLTAVWATYTVEETGVPKTIELDFQEAKHLTHGVGERFDREYRTGLARRAPVFIKKKDIDYPRYKDTIVIDEETWKVEQVEDSDPLWKLFISRDQRAKVH